MKKNFSHIYKALWEISQQFILLASDGSCYFHNRNQILYIQSGSVLPAFNSAIVTVKLPVPLNNLFSSSTAKFSLQQLVQNIIKILA